MYYYIHAHVLHDFNTFRERTRTCKYWSKTKPCNGRERSKYPPIREFFKYKRKAAEINRRVDLFLYRLKTRTCSNLSCEGYKPLEIFINNEL